VVLRACRAAAGVAYAALNDALKHEGFVIYAELGNLRLRA
jgi:hypothetical protein